ncbi:hypothetical protein OAQ99_06745 [Candidatus Kapabacteria bacterium]|nr:hypothetical protein [Candidatus Kapabacteria bacterium]
MSEIVFETKLTIARKLEDNLIECVRVKDAPKLIDEKLALKDIEALKKEVEKNPCVGFLFIVPNENVSLKARKAYSLVENYGAGMALVVESTSQRMIANFVVKFSKSESQTKFFNTKAKALEWIRQQIDIKVNTQIK